MTFNKTLLTAALFTFSGFTAMTGANAAADSGKFDVKLAITATCKVTSASGTQDINFGTHAAGENVTEASSGADISVNCSNGTAYNIGLAGTGKLTDPVSTNSVDYKLLKTAGGEVWGNTGTEVTGTGSGMAVGEAKLHKVFASLDAGSTANLSVGNYSDTVNVTVTY